jgi:hypothetical protein
MERRLIAASLLLLAACSMGSQSSSPVSSAARSPGGQSAEAVRFGTYIQRSVHGCV